MYHQLLISSALAVLALPGRALDNGLAITPAMGWNTWSTFGCSISEDVVLGAAQAIIDNGLDKLGYEYVNIDDCWQADNRSADGTPVADPTKFPNGMAYLASELHSMGLKFGLYSDAGTHTCGYKFGSLGFEDIDAQTYADWGVDLLKYDNCYNQGISGTPNISATRYRRMTDALNATGRPILYSLCSWGEDQVWNWGSTVGNSWRISGDLFEDWDAYDDRCPCTTSAEFCPLAGYHCSIMNLLEKAAGIQQKSRTGAWGDMDLLVVGFDALTWIEQAAHFSLWALAKSPLIMANDITDMSNDTLAILTNPYLIAINQDPNGSPGFRVEKDIQSDGTTTQVWKAQTSNSYIMALLNATPNNLTMNSSFTSFFRDQGPSAWEASWNFYDLWANGSFYGTFSGNISAEVPSHGVRIFNVTEASSGALEMGTAIPYQDGRIPNGSKVASDLVEPEVLFVNQAAAHDTAFGDGLTRDEL